MNVPENTQKFQNVLALVAMLKRLSKFTISKDHR
jgi:hypothetical protein